MSEREPPGKKNSSKEPEDALGNPLSVDGILKQERLYTRRWVLSALAAVSLITTVAAAATCQNPTIKDITETGKKLFNQALPPKPAS